MHITFDAVGGFVDVRTVKRTTTGEIKNSISPGDWNVGCSFLRLYPFPFNITRVISIYEIKARAAPRVREDAAAGCIRVAMKIA